VRKGAEIPRYPHEQLLHAGVAGFAVLLKRATDLGAGRGAPVLRHACGGKSQDVSPSINSNLLATARENGIRYSCLSGCKLGLRRRLLTSYGVDR